jgi:hypothetical protein
MIEKQTADQLHDIISWNDATIPGILIAITITLGAVVYYLFKTNQTLYSEFTKERDTLHKEHLNEIRSFNEVLIKINNQYSDSIRNLVELHKK